MKMSAFRYLGFTKTNQSMFHLQHNTAPEYNTNMSRGGCLLCMGYCVSEGVLLFWIHFSYFPISGRWYSSFQVNGLQRMSLARKKNYEGNGEFFFLSSVTSRPSYEMTGTPKNLQRNWWTCKEDKDRDRETERNTKRERERKNSSNFVSSFQKSV